MEPLPGPKRNEHGGSVGVLQASLFSDSPIWEGGCQEQLTEMGCSGNCGSFGELLILANEYSPVAFVARVLSPSNLKCLAMQTGERSEETHQSFTIPRFMRYRQ